MKKISRTVTIQVELDEQEYEALRLLSERIRHHEDYTSGELWKDNIIAIIGKSCTEAIVGMFGEEE